MSEGTSELKLPFDPKKIKDRIAGLADKVKGYVRKNKPLLKLICLVLALMWLSSHIKGCIREREAQKTYPRPVRTALSSKEDVPIYVESFGTLSSVNSVDIKAQVTGKIQEIKFKQGDSVKKGDLLIVIEPDEYQADLKKAEAQLEADLVDLELKKDNLDRNRPLLEKNLVAKQTFEQYETDYLAARAKVDLDVANVELAKINLGYCYIKSPVDGIVGKRQVDAGNIVSANTGPTLVNVKSVDELYVDFTLPERDLPRVRKAMSEGTLKVSILVDADGQKPHTGELDLIDNTVNEDTGTIALRATVGNKDKGLWPGQFVKVRLFLRTEKGAVVVPLEAAQIGKKGYYVFTVGKGDKAELNLVTVGEKYRDKIVIEKGLDAGETVITLGQLALRPGSKVIDTEKLPKRYRPPEVDEGKDEDKADKE